MNLTDLIGTNDAHWMNTPDRPCDPNTSHPQDIRAHADAWFPSEANAHRAKTLCNGCPVQSACLTYALNDPDLDGIWAATTKAERDQLRARRDGAAA